MQLFCVEFDHVHVLQTQRCDSLPGNGEHVWGLIDRDHLPAGSNTSSRGHGRLTNASGNIQNALASFNVSQRD
jgi:hypothetical protein